MQLRAMLQAATQHGVALNQAAVEAIQHVLLFDPVSDEKLSDCECVWNLCNMRAYRCSEGEWYSCCPGIEHEPVMGLLFSTTKFLKHKCFGSFLPTDITYVSIELTVLILLLVEDVCTAPVPIVVYTPA